MSKILISEKESELRNIETYACRRKHVSTNTYANKQTHRQTDSKCKTATTNVQYREN